MTLKDGLAAMRNSRREEKVVAESTRVEQSPAQQQDRKQPNSKKVIEKREPFATRLKPSLRHDLKRRILDLSEQGERVTVEDVIEALLTRYVEDKTFQQIIEETLS